MSSQLLKTNGVFIKMGLILNRVSTLLLLFAGAFPSSAHNSDEKPEQGNDYPDAQGDPRRARAIRTHHQRIEDGNHKTNRRYKRNHRRQKSVGRALALEVLGSNEYNCRPKEQARECPNQLIGSIHRHVIRRTGKLYWSNIF